MRTIKYIQAFCCSICILFCATAVSASDTLYSKQILQRIALLQSTNSSVFPKGSFASYRTYALNKHVQKADINAFYTGLICFILNDIYPDLDVDAQVIARTIIADALPYFSKFKNKKGRNTYNFWATDTPKIFPNGGWLNLMDRSRALPDDLDDTVMLLMAMNATDSVAKEVHNLMQQFAANNEKGVRNTYAEYKNIKAYSTWFGKKMPVEFDVSVLCNVLYFVQRYQLPWSASDSASLNLITQTLADKKHITAPGYVSPQYKNTATIFYHLSRLMSVKPIPELEKIKPQLIADATNSLLHANSFVEKILLTTSLLRWGVKPSPSLMLNEFVLNDFIEADQYPFFIANMSSILPNPFKALLTNAQLGSFNYYCPAFNQVLLLEHLVWNNRTSSNINL